MRRLHKKLDPSRADPTHKAPRGDWPPVAEQASTVPEDALRALQRSAGNAAVQHLLGETTVTHQADEGEPLPPATRRRAERRLATDLSSVRVHADPTARELAGNVGADAATIGQDIYLHRDPLRRDSSESKRTLMHEIVHAAQATGSPAREPKGVSDPRGAAETEAASIAAGGLGGSPSRPTQAAPAGIVHRQQAEERPEANLDFLGTEPLPEEPMTAKPDIEGADAVAFEITVLAPMRRALAAIEDQEWETALERIYPPGQAMVDYEQKYEKRDPTLAAQLNGIRGWLGILVTQLRFKSGSGQYSDQRMIEALEDGLKDLEALAKRFP